MLKSNLIQAVVVARDENGVIRVVSQMMSSQVSLLH